MPEAPKFVAYGAVRQLWRMLEWPGGMYQVLLEGPAGTGKTRGLLEWVNFVCEENPGIRILFLRKTKESLAESVLDTWENHVLQPGHPCITGTAQRNTRQHYTYPNGAHIVLGGLADKRQAEKTFSTQYDVVIVFESREIPDINQYHWLARANRNFRMPQQFRILDTNPGAEFHWINQLFPKAAEGGAFHRIPKKFRNAPPFTVRCDERHLTVIPRPGGLELDDTGHLTLPCPQCEGTAKGANMFRLLSKFRDNPVWWDANTGTWTEQGLEYVEGNLALLSGAPRANLYEGRWASEEGVIFEDWDPAVHVVEPGVEADYSWFFGSFDPGFRHPACFQVWGVQLDPKGDRMTRVLEMYRTEQNSDWWAEQILKAHKQYDLGAVVVDAADPGFVDMLNQRMGHRRGRDGDWIARRCHKGPGSILTGIDTLRWALSKRDGGPRFFIARGSLQGKDPARVAKLKPACFEEEIGSYVWAKSEDGKPRPEKPDVLCPDHSIDAAMYACVFLWRNDLRPVDPEPEYEVGTLGDMLGFQAILPAKRDTEPEG